MSVSSSSPITRELASLGWTVSDLHRAVNAERVARAPKSKPLTFQTVYAWVQYGTRPDPDNLDVLAAVLPLSADDVAAIQRITVDPDGVRAKLEETAPES